MFLVHVYVNMYVHVHVCVESAESSRVGSGRIDVSCRVVSVVGRRSVNQHLAQSLIHTFSSCWIAQNMEMIE